MTATLCGNARVQFHKLQTARDNGTLDKVVGLARQLQSTRSPQTVSAVVNDLGRSLNSVVRSLKSLGLDNPDAARARLISMQNGANDLASAGRQVADGVQMLVDQTKNMGIGLNQASAFLMAMGNDASQPSMAGFNVPPQVLKSEEFKSRPGVHLARRAYRAVLHSDRPQPVQHCGHGSGQHDH